MVSDPTTRVRGCVIMDLWVHARVEFNHGLYMVESWDIGIWQQTWKDWNYKSISVDFVNESWKYGSAEWGKLHWILPCFQSNPQLWWNYEFAGGVLPLWKPRDSPLAKHPQTACFCGSHLNSSFKTGTRNAHIMKHLKACLKIKPPTVYHMMYHDINQRIKKTHAFDCLIGPIIG